LAVETLQDEILQAQRKEEDAVKRYEESQKDVTRLSELLAR
jgi:hypothetical protein